MECLKFMKDFLTIAFLLILKQYQNSSQLVERKPSSSNHVLLRLTENCKKFIDDKNFVDDVLMNLCKAFDCILHDLLIAKVHIYGLSEDAVTIVYS